MPADAPSPQPLTEEQREWVRRNAGVVQQVARRVGHKLRDVHESDLVSAGEEGLVQAAREYDPEGGRTFASWAWIRVQGATSMRCGSCTRSASGSRMRGGR